MDGDVFVIKDAGRDFYAWRSMEVERSSGVRHETSLNSKETAIDETQQLQMGAFFDNFNPQLGQPKALTNDQNLKSPTGTFSMYMFSNCFFH